MNPAPPTRPRTTKRHEAQGFRPGRERPDARGPSHLEPHHRHGLDAPNAQGREGHARAEAPAHLIAPIPDHPLSRAEKPPAKTSPARFARTEPTSEQRSPVRPAPSRLRPAPEDLEPRRKQRLSRERDPIEARIDLHGFGRFEAEDQLRAFLTGCQARGLRAVLVITGQGRLGGGIIRASFAEWMQSPALRGVVSGFTSAHRRHGGDGAFYVTLKRRG
ncbi:Smr/MutS family protein [Brevundimonas aurantiaca]|uniref:Smr/MutS family protein n=1 Tax=Brevundimonas aurantiaca TaxID=74316 RepID=UPI001CD6CE37|nr:Smr/MutS family protein [Brevundimonas aurantiaca]